MNGNGKRPGRPESKPYTVIGIGRLSCVRCGEPASTTWQVCADQRMLRPLCWECDVALNEMVLLWAGWSKEEVTAMISDYRDTGGG